MCLGMWRKKGLVSFTEPDYSTTFPQPMSPAGCWYMFCKSAYFVSSLWLFCAFPMCPVFVIATGRIQWTEGRSNTANPIFLNLLMQTASLAKPVWSWENPEAQINSAPRYCLMPGGIPVESHWKTDKVCNTLHIRDKYIKIWTAPVLTRKELYQVSRAITTVFLGLVISATH